MKRAAATEVYLSSHRWNEDPTKLFLNCEARTDSNGMLTVISPDSDMIGGGVAVAFFPEGSWFRCEVLWEEVTK